MKTFLILVFVLTLLFSNVYGQDTSKVQIVFQTKLNQKIPIYKYVYLGDINLEGYVQTDLGIELTHQVGILSKEEFLFNAPYTGYFERNKPVVLVMADDYANKIKFTIRPGLGNQKWLLTPPGKEYQRSLFMRRNGIGGFLVSSVLLAVVILNNQYKIQSYHMNLDHYNFAKNGMFDPGPEPQAPKNLGLKYALPALAYGLTFHAIIKGRKLYVKNRPIIERID